MGLSLISYLENLFGVPFEQLNFVFIELIGFIGGLLLRTFLKPNEKNTKNRHLFVGLLGLLLAYLCYGNQIFHILTQGFICYVILLTVPRHQVHIYTFIASMGYLSFIHFDRVFGHGYQTIDITGTLMVTTQKLTSLAFAYYDGQKREEKLSDDQKDQVIRKLPSFIEFWSYILNFQSIIVGPLCFYSDYIDFITGNNILKHQKSAGKTVNEPDILIPIVKKLLIFSILAMLSFKLTPLYTIQEKWNDELAAQSLIQKSIFAILAAFTARLKYYLAWTLADIVANASGFGFNGYDENGKAKWDLMTNVNILNIEFSTNLKAFTDSWNIKTQVWLIRICYTRLPYMNTLGVFLLSAFWHGFYPGFYMTFMHWAIMIHTARLVRRKFRQSFQKNEILKIIYAILTWSATLMCRSYTTASFELRHFWLCLSFYNSFNWCLTISTILLAISLSMFKEKRLKDDINGIKIK